ncbi:hypothetical protein SAMN05660226_00118 [Parapedobacter luteus]|uniref:Uncharacterized protein n=1 Tax=Parapedobacter luteus TaxID=623280 RepID=A0A1T4ZV17_9SPHI|nr:hypothetical protein SAMN05660226_00118 [Parapedobacter luteus]
MFIRYIVLLIVFLQSGGLCLAQAAISGRVVVDSDEQPIGNSMPIAKLRHTFCQWLSVAGNVCNS